MSGILVIAEQRRGELRPVTLELVSAAQSARRSPAERVAVAVLAEEPERFIPAVSVAGVDEVIAVPVAAREFDPDVLEAAALALIAARSPSLVLVPHSIDAFGWAAALAVKGNYGFATDVFRLGYEDGMLRATRAGYGQKVNVELDFPGKETVVLAVRANVFKTPEGQAHPAVSRFEPPPAHSRLRAREFVESSAGADDVDMSGAEFILAIGRGIGEQANVQQFQELAGALGAALGCSRPVADAGWLPKSRQIGQSGKTASACKLYIAMGISGAIQHLAGMKHVSTIIAVNADPAASIFSVATYGVVADIFEIAAALRENFPG
jgi:electron transfer flavoprotein alpha subunit